MPFYGIRRCDWLCCCRFCSFSHVRPAVFWPLFGAKVGINNPTNKIFYHFFRIFLRFFRPKLFCLAERKPQIAENVCIAPSATFRQPDCHFLAVSRKCDEDERVREGGTAEVGQNSQSGQSGQSGRGRRGVAEPQAPGEAATARVPLGAEPPPRAQKKSSSAKELLCCRPQAVDYLELLL